MSYGNQKTPEENLPEVKGKDLRIINDAYARKEEEKRGVMEREKRDFTDRDL